MLVMAALRCAARCSVTAVAFSSRRLVSPAAHLESCVVGLLYFKRMVCLAKWCTVVRMRLCVLLTALAPWLDPLRPGHRILQWLLPAVLTGFSKGWVATSRVWQRRACVHLCLQMFESWWASGELGRVCPVGRM